MKKRTDKLWMLVLVLLVLAGCNRHLINYEISALKAGVDSRAFIAIDTLEDQRPVEERKGHSGKFLAFASKDDDFIQSPKISITNLVKKELQNAGFKVVERKKGIDYRISGEILHFQTMVKHPGTMVVPYLGTVATLWESDEYTTVVTIRARMERVASGKILFEREFNISEKLRLKTGILNLERWFGRGMGYKFKRLDIALADVLEQLRDEVIKSLTY